MLKLKWTITEMKNSLSEFNLKFKVADKKQTNKTKTVPLTTENRNHLIGETEREK